VTETRWPLSLAAQAPFIRGVVGWLDLCSPDISSTLADFASEPKLVGLRHMLQDEPDDDFILRGDFRRGLGALSDAGLTYDLLVFPRHLRNARTVVREFPALHFIVDHPAKPSIAGRDLASWEPGFRALAAEPNVACKLSGMVTEADWHAWSATDFAPFLDVAFDAFGPDRLLFGSDWPVCELAASYAQVADLIEARLAGDAAVRDAVMGGNAARWYRLANGGV
jgi:L-fuconolactonase